MTESEPKTPNQIVAYNLRRARELRGFSQEEAGKRLEPFLGTRWSKATWSAAEQTYVRTDRPRKFDPDQIVAFARAFDLPVAWFFLPPASDPLALPITVIFPDGEPLTATIDRYVELVQGPLANKPEFQAEALRRALKWAQGHTEAAFEAQFGSLDAAVDQLSQLVTKLLELKGSAYERVVEEYERRASQAQDEDGGEGS